MTNKIKLSAGSLASRPAASVIRKQLESAIADGCVVSVDLSAVDSISNAYADELFGVLASKLTFDRFLSSVELVAPAEHVLREIASAITYRLDSIPAAKRAA